MSKLHSRTIFGAALLGAAVALTGIAGTVQADGHGQDQHAKAEIGKAAPTFTLTDTDGKTHALQQYLDDGKVVVLEWFNPQCPFVVKHHEHNSTMHDTYKAFADEDVVWLAINSGAPGKQGHGLDLNKKMKTEWEMAYPILMDESGDVGRMYEAKTTPHMFVITAEGVLAYDGAIDNNRSPRTVGDVNYVHNALKAVLAGETVAEAKTRPYGCSVKY
jgi:peroxiredoxin